MNSKVIWTSVFALTALLFSGSSGVLPNNSYASIGVMKDKVPGLDKQILSSMGLDKDQFTKAGQHLLDGLSSGDINGKWLESHGLDSNLFDGVDNDELIETTEFVLTNFNDGGLDKQSIQTLLDNDDYEDGAGGYGGAYVLILVLFILLVIIGAGMG